MLYKKRNGAIIFCCWESKTTRPRDSYLEFIYAEGQWPVFMYAHMRCNLETNTFTDRIYIFWIVLRNSPFDFEAQIFFINYIVKFSCNNYYLH